MELVTYNKYVPGLMSRIIEMHAKYYHRFFNFGLAYEIHLGNELATFLQNYQIEKDLLLFAQSEDEIIGSITIKRDKDQMNLAQLIWYIMDEDYIGYGVGGELMNKAMEFCQSKEVSKIFLWTFKGLYLAENLYLKNGFKLGIEKENLEWGSPLIEQYYEKLL